MSFAKQIKQAKIDIHDILAELEEKHDEEVLKLDEKIVELESKLNPDGKG